MMRPWMMVGLMVGPTVGLKAEMPKAETKVGTRLEKERLRTLLLSH
jgi:hypothetical protein